MRAKRYSTSVFKLRSACAYTLPPRPPSPPLGPPRGMYFSRLNAAAPSPPFPACTSIVASSTNFVFAPRVNLGSKNNELHVNHGGTETTEKTTRRLREDRPLAFSVLSVSPWLIANQKTTNFMLTTEPRRPQRKTARKLREGTKPSSRNVLPFSVPPCLRG